MSMYRKAQAVVEYAVLVALLVMVFLAMHAYIARGMRGQIQASSDQLADQYAYGLSEINEVTVSSVNSTEWSLPGWNHPTSITSLSGSQTTRAEKKIRPLDETWLK